MIKTIIETDIDPEGRLNAWVKKYKEYEDALKKTPNIWAKAGKEAAGAATSFEAGLAALLAMLDIASQLADQTDKAKRKSKETGDSWKDAAKWSKQFAGNVYSATISLAKWVGIGTAISGLVGAGGLWGLDRLAGGAGAARRQAQGLGLSIGQQRAFEVDLGRLVEPSLFLGGVNEALTDATKRRFLYAGGLSGGDLAGKNTAQVSIALLTSIKRLADNTDPKLLGQLLQARGLGQFGLGVEDLRRLRDTPTRDLRGFISQYTRDQGAFGFDDATAQKWQDLDRALESSKTKIEAAFVIGLAPLTKGIAGLSDAAANAIRTFLLSRDLKADLVSFGGDLEWLVREIAKPEFQNGIKSFTSNVVLAAEGIVNALRWLGLVPNTTEGIAANNAKNAQADAAWYAGTTALGPFGDLLNAPENIAGALGVIHDALPPPLTRGDRLGDFTEDLASTWLAAKFPGIRITGEARTPERNRQVGGARDSMHLTGQAIDFVLPKGTTIDQFRAYLAASGLPVSELLNEGRIGSQGAHVHWGWRPKAEHHTVVQHHQAPPHVKITVNNNTGGNAVVNARQLAQ